MEIMNLYVFYIVKQSNKFTMFSVKKCVYGLVMICACVILFPILPKYMLKGVMDIIIIYGYWEFANLIPIERSYVYIRITNFMFYVVSYISVNVFMLYSGVSDMIMAGVIILYIAWTTYEMLNYQTEKMKILNKRCGRWFFSFVTMILCKYSFNIVIYSELGGEYFFTHLILMTALSDIAGMFIGKTLGYKRLSPISPNKTTAGFYGSIIVCSLYLYIIYMLGVSAISIALLYPGIFGAIYGDLIISLCKRYANIKDTGELIPGHGGLLDRIDSGIGSVIIVSLALILVC